MSGRFERVSSSTLSSKKKANFYNNEGSADKAEKLELFYENRNKIDTWLN